MRRIAGRIALTVLLTLGVEGCMNGTAETPTKRRGDAFAADREAPVKPAAFDAPRAMGYLEALCKIGPRISGSEGMKKQQEMLEKHFKDQGGKIRWQRFTATQKSDPRHQKVVDGQPHRLLASRPRAARHPLLALRHPPHCRSGAGSRATGASPSSAPTTAAPASPCSWSWPTT